MDNKIEGLSAKKTFKTSDHKTVVVPVSICSVSSSVFGTSLSTSLNYKILKGENPVQDIFLPFNHLI